MVIGGINNYSQWYYPKKDKVKPVTKTELPKEMNNDLNKK